MARLDLIFVTTAHKSRAWRIPVLRAIPAAAVALTITFSPDHSTSLGFLATGVWAILTAIVVANGAVRALLPRQLFVALAALLVVGGTAALVLFIQPIAVLLFLVSTLLGFTGALELVGGVVLRRFSQARDWIFVGAIGAATAIGVLLIPADYSVQVGAPDSGLPPLTASVMVVGLFGAYCAIVAVYLVIAGLSQKWSPDAASAVPDGAATAKATTEKK